MTIQLVWDDIESWEQIIGYWVKIRSTMGTHTWFN